LPTARRVALPADAGLTGRTGVAAATVIGVGLRVDARSAALRALGTAALPVYATEIAGARGLTIAAVIVGVAGIDAERAAQDLTAGAAALAVAVDAGVSAPATITTAAAVQGVGLGVDAGVTALDGVGLAFLGLLLFLLLGVACRGTTKDRTHAKRGQESPETPAREDAGQVQRELVKTLGVHVSLLLL
jgi:hypothetical protein